MDDLVSQYGDVTLVNLVNHTGYEASIKETMERSLANLKHPRIKYEYFDFHTECSKMRWHRISLLIDRLRDTLLSQGFFLDDRSGEVSNRQQSVIRSNCMDCLDRTNVVQSAIASWVLSQQLRYAGIIQSQDRIDNYPEFQVIFRKRWFFNSNFDSTEL